MSVIGVHHDDFADGSVVSRVLGWFTVAFKTMHQAIVAAKLERLESELIVRRGYEEQALQYDAVRYPQRPLILSEKWDF